MRAVEIHNPHHLRHCLPATPTTPPKPETEFRFKFLRSRNIQKAKWQSGSKCPADNRQKFCNPSQRTAKPHTKGIVLEDHTERNNGIK